MGGIIVSPGYALSAIAAAEGWKPVIGWQSVIRASGLAADHQAAGYPASNLANSSTVEGWRSDTTGNQTVRALFDAAEVDYLGVVRPNWAAGSIPVVIEGLPPEGDPDENGDWEELIAEHLLGDDGPTMYRWPVTMLIGLRLRFLEGTAPPRCAAIKAGKLIVLQEGLPPGHQPIPFARTQTVASLRSQGGDYLGSVVTSSQLSSNIVQRNLDPAWYRAHLEPFRRAQPDPFFWAWAPQHYPNEVGYCWVTNDPIPVVATAPDFVDITFEIGGVP